jgi:GntR family transcriptional regulator
VRDALAERIVRREWQPGATLPNEVELSRQMQVSQGTVRKALSELETEHLVTRRQGRGTFVNDLATTDAAKRFSNLRGPDNRRVATSVSYRQVTTTPASPEERARLELEADEPVIRIRRVRLIQQKPFMLEDISMPAARFPGLERQLRPPIKIAAMAQQYGLLLGSAKEKVSLTRADREIAEALAVPTDTPLLHLDRLIHLMDGPPIQWRIAHCHLKDQHYLVEMGGNGRKRKH